MTADAEPVFTCFSIRSFGSWGEAQTGIIEDVVPTACFSIRSFGSWGEATGTETSQPPRQAVSVSALSDRRVKRFIDSFFPNWHDAFQYPLFRIVG